MPNLFQDFNPEIKQEQYLNHTAYLANNCVAIEGMIALYNLGLIEKSIVKAQNKILLSQYLPTDSTLFLKDTKQRKERYILPTTWKETFKLIKLLWQTRQLA